MSQGPVLSVCVLSWNTCQLLAECLGSLYADPDAAEWEVIVVDNASADGSAAMVQRCFPRTRLIASDRNLGFSGGNNLALQQAAGRYLLLLNSDTRVQPGALTALVGFAAATPDAGAAGPMLLNGDGSLQLSCGIAPSLRTEMANKLLLHNLFPFYKLGRWDHWQVRSVDWVSGACLLVRREVLQEVGLLDPRFYMCHEDVDWCMRIRSRGWRIYYYPFSRVVHVGGQSTCQNLQEMLVVSQRSLYYLFDKHFGRRQLYALRLMTLVEMALRSAVWTGLLVSSSSRRREARQRLAAYRQIALRSLTDRTYWAPAGAAE